MLKNLLLMAMTLALATGAAVAKTHSVILYTPTHIAGEDLKPGKYKLEIEGNSVTISNGKQKVETSAKVEEAPEKFSKDSVRYVEADGKMTVREIRVGGTNTKLVFGGTSPNTSAQ